MSDGQEAFAVISGIVFIFAAFIWLNESDMGKDLMEAVHKVWRRRLRIWARGHGASLWEGDDVSDH